jgi:hypothetical protein
MARTAREHVIPSLLVRAAAWCAPSLLHTPPCLLAGDSDQPLQSAVDLFIKDRRLPGPKVDQLLAAVNFELEHDYAADADQLSLWWFDRDESTGKTDCVLPEGMCQVGNQRAVRCMWQRVVHCSSSWQHAWHWPHQPWAAQCSKMYRCQVARWYVIPSAWA